MICNVNANMQYKCNADTSFSHNCNGSCTEHPNNKITSSQIHNSHQELFWFTLFACRVPGFRGREKFRHELLQSQVTEVVMLKGYLCNPLVRRGGIQEYLNLWVLKSGNIKEKNAFHHCWLQTDIFYLESGALRQLFCFSGMHCCVNGLLDHDIPKQQYLHLQAAVPVGLINPVYNLCSLAS